MPVTTPGPTVRGWWRDHANDRLVGVYEGTQVFRINGSGLSTPGGEITNSVVQAAGLAENSLADHGIPLTSWVGPTGLVLTASETAGSFNRSISTNVFVLKGEVTDNETEVSVMVALYTLPPNYVAGGDLTFRVRCALIKSGSPTDNGSTIDLSAYLQGDGAVGSDLVATSAATFAALDTWYNKDFVITPTGLVAGDRLSLVLTTSVIDSEAGAGTIIANIAKTAMLADVRI